MNIISVIPISRGIGKERLIYFTSSEVSIGSIVEVPLRRKTIDALVIEIDDVRDYKSEIKSASFALRRAKSLIAKPFLSEAFMKAINETARFHAATTGAVLNVLLAKKIIKEKIFSLKEVKGVKEEKTSHKSAFAGSFKERVDLYEKEIEKAKKVAKKSLLLCQQK